MIRKLLLASAAVAIATPAVARDGQPYVGLEGGVLFPQNENGNLKATFTQGAQSPAAGTPAAAPGTGSVGTLPLALRTVPTIIEQDPNIRYKTGYDIDAVGGYDFGFFRLEAELGYKSTKVKDRKSVV